MADPVTGPPALRACPACSGAGAVRCPACCGAGGEWESGGGMARCNPCGGAGTLPCEACGGEGTIGWPSDREAA